MEFGNLVVLGSPESLKVVIELGVNCEMVLSKVFYVFLVIILLLVEFLTESILVLVPLGHVQGASIVALLHHIFEVGIGLFEVGGSASLVALKVRLVLCVECGVLTIALFKLLSVTGSDVIQLGLVD